MTTVIKTLKQNNTHTDKTTQWVRTLKQFYTSLFYMQTILQSDTEEKNLTSF